MATETLDPNAVGSSNNYSLSAGSSDAEKVALVNDSDDATYVYGATGIEETQKWYIVIDGSGILDGSEPTTNTGASAADFTRVINGTNFSGCPTITKALITSLQIGQKTHTGPGIKHQTFNLDDPTFPDGATINSVTIHARASWTSNQSRVHKLSLVVDYTEVIPPTLLKIKSGTLTIKSGKLIIK